MREPHYGDDQPTVLDDVHHTMVTDSQAHRAGWLASEWASTWWTRIGAELGDRNKEVARDGLLQLAKFS